MVKFRVRESRPEPKEPEVEFWLDVDTTGDLRLMASDDKGEVNLAFISVRNGAIWRFSGEREMDGLSYSDGKISFGN